VLLHFVRKSVLFTVKVGDTYALLVYVLLDVFCLSHFYIYLFTANGLLPVAVVILHVNKT